MRAKDRFRPGSIVKTFVAAATLQLVEERRFALDDPLPSVLPARTIARFPEAEPITVRMLLDHTSGIAYYNDQAFEGEVAADPRRRWKVGELLDRAAAMPRTGAPGERWSYSNTNYNLLGLVLEHELVVEAARDADHHRVARLALGVGQQRVRWSGRPARTRVVREPADGLTG